MPSPRQTLRGVFVAHGLLFASWAAHIPHVKSHLGLTNATLGLVLLATPIGSVSAMALAAWLMPRLGSRRMVAVTLAGYCLAGPFVGIAPSPAALAAALLVWGAFQGTLDVAMNTQAVSQERIVGQTLMSGLHGGWSIGALAGAGIGAASVSAGISLTVQMIVLGAFVLVGSWLTRTLLDDPPPDPLHAPQRRGRRRLPKVSGAVVLLSAVAGASFLCEGAAADWSAVYLRDSVGTSAGLASAGYAAFMVAMVAVRLRADALFARFDVSRVLSVLASLAAVGFTAALVSDNVVVGLIGFVTLGVGLAAVVPTAFGAAGRVPGVLPGAGIAVVSAAGWAGFVCGPPLIGQLSAATSLPVALGLLPLLTGFIAVVTRRRLGPLLAPPAASDERETVVGRAQ